MSRKGLRQWAAVSRMRELKTSAEQKPASSPPRISTMATRSAKRPSGAAPTSARAGASGATSAASIANNRKQRRAAEVMGGFMRQNAGASIAVQGRRPLPPSCRFAPRRQKSRFQPATGARPFTLHSAANANIVAQRFATEALSSWPRSPWFAAPRPGARVMTCASANAAEAEEHARRREAGLPQRRRDPRGGQVPPPARAVRGAQIRRRATQGRGPSARLCHTGDEFIYEITLLHRDGRLVHVEMEAATGKVVARPGQSRTTHESHEPQVKN